MAIVRSVYAAFNALAQGGDTASYVTEHFDLDCVYSPVEEANTIRGHEALTRWINRWLDAWDDAWDEIDEIPPVASTSSPRPGSMAVVDAAEWRSVSGSSTSSRSATAG